MSIIKLNNNSVKNVTTFGSATGGSMNFISKTTISSPVSSVQFTSGIDNTYKEYLFHLVNLHPNSNSEPDIAINFSIDGGSNYNVTKTSTSFYARHAENDDFASLSYDTSQDLSQSTGVQYVGFNQEGADADASLSGFIRLFIPSSTTFVKHYIGAVSYMHDYPAAWHQRFAGYCNTTSAVNAVSFIGEYGEGTSGNIDAGTIILYGIN